MTEQKRMDLPVNEQAAPVAEPAPAAEQAAPSENTTGDLSEKGKGSANQEQTQE